MKASEGVYLYVFIIIIALKPFVGPWPLFQFLDLVHSQ
jgi:hypothetical protein